MPLNGVTRTTKETGIVLNSFLLSFNKMMVVMVRKTNCHVALHSWMQYKAQAMNVQLKRHHNIWIAYCFRLLMFMGITKKSTIKSYYSCDLFLQMFILVKTSSLLRFNSLQNSCTGHQNTYLDVPQLCKISAILSTENIYTNRSLTVER